MRHQLALALAGIPPLAHSAHGFEPGWTTVFQVLAGKPLASGEFELPDTCEYVNARQK